MKDAITRAIEGGYRNDIVDWHKNLCTCDGSVECSARDFYRASVHSKVLLDPLFWQALLRNINGGVLPHKKIWTSVWKQFIDHLAEGKDAEEFFKDLLK